MGSYVPGLLLVFCWLKLNCMATQLQRGQKKCDQEDKGKFGEKLCSLCLRSGDESTSSNPELSDSKPKASIGWVYS